MPHAAAFPGSPDGRFWTPEEVLALPPDGRRYEVARGELLVTPAPGPGHQGLLAALYDRLLPWLQAEGLGRCYWSPADLRFGPTTLLQPDLFVVPAALGRLTRWEDVRDLLLVVEALSPGTARQDRFAKRHCYMAAGVPAYWILDAEQRQVEVWTPGEEVARVERQELRWRPAGAGTTFVLDIAGLFDAA
ncbi:MAG: Uma2 family endonuclease [Gemmatimonadetes bacterium]|nr:Uma2 family endonuclease [Gemmatimonadota bacterium]